MTEKDKQKPWGGRFTKAMDDLLEIFSASIHFDHKLYAQDIAGSQAHARMLGRQGLVSEDEAALMVKGLEEIKQEIEAGEFTWDPQLEDVHMNIEKALTGKIGPAGEKLHTARSRNDQIALDTRLYLKEMIHLLAEHIMDLRRAIVDQAAAHQDLIMPGYTHTQRAQPVLLAHHLLAYYEMLKRDGQRLADMYPRVDVMPLGSAALAGTGLPIDPEFVAEELGFNQITANSMDGVSDRDYIIEFLAAASILMMHLSRLSEDLILWSTSEFGFVELPDDLTTGSSIMPQKKNPDTCELIRGKTGRIYGNLINLLTVMKGMPLAYNRDFQEDKEPLFDTVETLALALPLMTRLISNLDFNAGRMLEAADDPVVTATDLADYLVKQGVPFRLAHEQVGSLVRHCVDNNIGLADVEESEMARFCPDIKPGVKDVLTISASVEARVSPGGTAPSRVRAALKHALDELKK
ncbi:MAG: argininosuccinate lyase [Deltaproteobacteria bacterium]|nr:argininosuccinate lyase [Deltaproteobacteria bacterium]